MTADWAPPTELPDSRCVGKIALDTETRDNRLIAKMGSGWPFADGYICGISIAYREGRGIRALYFPIRHPDSANFDPARLYGWLKDLLASDVHVVTQNGLYDFGWLRTEGDIKMPPTDLLDEIGALATLVDEHRFRYSLDALSAWRGLPGKDLALLRQAAAACGLPKRAKPQSYIWQLPARYVGPYAEADAASTLALFENLEPILDREATRTAYRLESIYCRWCTRCAVAASVLMSLPLSARATTCCRNVTLYLRSYPPSSAPRRHGRDRPQQVVGGSLRQAQNPISAHRKGQPFVHRRKHRLDAATSPLAAAVDCQSRQTEQRRD